MSITLCMIVKNEEKNLAECVGSVKDIVDEIVIADTGSEDNTVAVAKELGALVFSIEWDNDFSKARNYALSQVSSDWVLVLDGDEKISLKDHGKIVSLTNQSEIDGFYVVQRHYLPGAGYDKWIATDGTYPDMEKRFSGYADNYAMRLFRKGDGIEWVGRVHETVVCNKKTTKWVAAKSNVVIHHYGKVGETDTLEKKKRAYLELSRLKVEDSGKDPMAWLELGLQLHELGMWEECIAPFETAYSLDSKYTSALYYVGNTQHKLGRLELAETALAMLIEKDPDNADAVVSLGLVMTKTGDVKKAEELFRKAVTLKDDLFSGWFNMGALLLSTGEYEKGGECLVKSLELMPNHLPSMFGKWQADLYSGKFDDAGNDMKIWLTIHPALKISVMGVVEDIYNKGKFEMVEGALGELYEILDDSLAYAALGASRLSSGKTDDAERLFTKAVEKDANRNDARINLAQLKDVCRKDKKSAFALYEEALKYDPQNQLCLQRLSSLKSNE